MKPADDLFELVKQGDLESLRTRLSADPEQAGQRHPAGLSLLIYACYQHRFELAQEIRRSLPGLDLFEASALPGAEAESEGAALLAADPGRARTWSTDGFTPLHLAAYFGNAPMAARLLEADADPNAEARNGSRLRPIHSAAAGRCLEISRLLLAAGADPNARQQGEFTALHAAAQQGDAPLVGLLLEHGADREARDDQGRTAADWARERGHAELAVRLAAATPVR